MAAVPPAGAAPRLLWLPPPRLVVGLWGCSEVVSPCVPPASCPVSVTTVKLL